MIQIVLHDTKTKRKMPLQPLTPGKVGMYVCGPTVYDRAHIGNARPVVVFDTLNRLLRHVYGDANVTYVRNFTDVDDKINARAAESGRDISDITEETIGWYLDDMAALGAMQPDHAPRATQSIDAMIAMIQELIAKGHAYEEKKHVLFEVRKDAGYGSLSHRNVDDMIAGARVDVAPYKRDAMDFVLWKPSHADTPGWDSPWGRGRPGWHIECSAMAREVFGERFDIHGGGNDLMFPHHENEAAQSRCAHGHDGMASIWMHNGMLNVEGAKMSKSLGNFFTVKDLLDKGIPGEVIRFVLLSSHYRSPLDWTRKRVYEADIAVTEMAAMLGNRGVQALSDLTPSQPFDFIVDALANDLNTSEALSLLRRKALKSKLNDVVLADRIQEIYASQILLGFDLKHHEAATRSAIQTDEVNGIILRELERTEEEALIERLISARENARKDRDFARSDAIRDGFAAAGVIVKDTADGATWELSPDFDATKLEGLA